VIGADLDEEIEDSRNVTSNLGGKKKKKKKKRKSANVAGGSDFPSSILKGVEGIGGTEVIPNRSSNMNNNKSNEMHLEDITDN